jgi:predicted lactoylglutathione lyase
MGTSASRKLFVNVAVRDLKRSMAFFTHHISRGLE